VHRDLKPSNLLVDENFRVKICDFGLSINSQKNTTVHNSMAYGTPRYMSPEVICGECVTEKADVYSFGIVVWEILNEKEPFDDIDDVSEIISGVTQHNKRPPLNSKTHPSLNKLITDCWDQDPNLRPDFYKILSKMDEITIESILIDPTACEIWKKWKGKKEIGFKRFYLRLCKKLCIKTPPNLNENLDYLCLFSLISTEREKKNVVTLEKFGLFLKWFGPLIPKEEDTTIFANVRKILKEDWFFGDVTRKFAENLLSSFYKQIGTYLIRLSLTNSETYPFTISKVKKDRVINHHKIYKSKRDYTLYVKIKQKNNKYEKVRGKDLNSLVENISSVLGLKYECIGRKYNELFLGEKPATTRDDSNSDETE
jgi:hypothetical protein